MRTYTIFLASSYELQPEREKFEIFIGRQNKRLLKKNVQLRLEIWEDMGAELNNGRKQEDYNKILNDADIVVVLFWTKMGKYTREEFELAYQRFLNSGDKRRPLVYVYEKTAPSPFEPEESKKEFIKRLQTEGEEQFHSTFQHNGDLLYHFQHTLFDLFDKGTLQAGESINILSRNAPHSPSFVIGRQKEMEFISEKLSNRGSIVLLSGEGGMGKTTLAAKYWHENKYTYGHGVYLFCEHGILNAMMHDRLGLEFQGLDEDQKIRHIQNKLKNLGDDVLLLLDNANDVEDIMLFFKVFSGFNGNILITSRCREVLVHVENEILIKHLQPTDSKELFTKNYREEGPDFDSLLEKFLYAIDYHTLLIEVFSKNLRRASARGIDLESFLQQFENMGIHLDRIANALVETDYAFFINKKVATPNEILEVLYDFSELGEAERRCLVNLALIPVNNYSQKFLLEIFDPENKAEFYETLDSLYQKGWIGGEYDALRLSPVVQNLVIHRNKETLWEDGKEWVKNLTTLIEYQGSNDDANKRVKWMPFCILVALVFKSNETKEMYQFLNHYGMLLIRIGSRENLEEAKGFLEKILKSNIQEFGECSVDVAISRSNLAMVFKVINGKKNLLFAKEQLEAAIDIFKRLSLGHTNQVSICQSNLGAVLADIGGSKNLLQAKEYLSLAHRSEIQWSGFFSHPVSICRSNLANVLKTIGGGDNLIEAKKLLEDSLYAAIRNFGNDSPAVAIIRTNLAGVLMEIDGKESLNIAKNLIEQSLSSAIQNFGDKSIDVAVIRQSLALNLSYIGGVKNLLLSKELLEKSLASQIQNFGENSTQASVIYSELASVLRDLDGEENLRLAKKYLLKSLESSIENYGENSERVIQVRSIFANIVQSLGGNENLILAKQNFELVVSAYIFHFGEDSPQVSLSRSNLAIVLGELGGNENILQAKRLFEMAIRSTILNFGENSTKTANMQSNLASVLLKFGGKENLLNAKILLENALNIEVAILGEFSPSVAIKRSNLAITLKELGGNSNLTEARLQMELALASNIRNFGKDHPLVAESRSNLGTILLDIGGLKELNEAKIILRKAIDSEVYIMGEKSASVARIMSNLAIVLQKIGGSGNLLESKVLLERAMASNIDNFGANDQSVSDNQSNLAMILRALGGNSNLSYAMELLNKAIDSDYRNLGLDHPSTYLKKWNLGTVYMDFGGSENIRKAISLFKEVLSGYIKHFGREYFLVPRVLQYIVHSERALIESEKRP